MDEKIYLAVVFGKGSVYSLKYITYHYIMTGTKSGKLRAKIKGGNSRKVH
jgi:hypothetical protein